MAILHLLLKIIKKQLRRILKPLNSILKIIATFPIGPQLTIILEIISSVFLIAKMRIVSKQISLKHSGEKVWHANRS